MCVLFVNCKLACNFVHTKTLNYFLSLCVSAWVIKIVNKVLRGAIVAWRGNFVLKGQFYEKSRERTRKRERERKRKREGKRAKKYEFSLLS